jgi:hypothetical protein
MSESDDEDDVYDPEEAAEHNAWLSLFMGTAILITLTILSCTIYRAVYR